MNLIFRALVKEANLFFENPQRIEKYLVSIEGHTVEVVLRRLTSPRSNQQNKYYWGVIIDVLSRELGYTEEETHEALKIKFLPKPGGVLPTVRSTKDLSIQEMSEYCESIRRWAAEFLSVSVPEPNEAE